MQIIKRKLLIGLCVLLPAVVSATDLMEVYEQARVSDAQYQAALMKFKGDVLTLDMSTSRYKPNVSFTYRAAQNDYESDQLDVSQLDVSGCTDLNCIIDRVNRLNAEGTRSNYTSQQSSLVLTQTIYDASLLAENRKAKAFVEKSKQEMIDAEQELIMRVVAGYMQALKAIDEKRLLEGQLARAATLRLLAEKRYQLGVGKQHELYEAQVFHDTQAMALMTAEASHAIAIRQLENLAGKPVGNLAILSENMEIAAIGGKTPGQWQQQARQRNNAVQAARAFEQISYFDWHARKNAAIPKFNFAVTYLDEDLSGGKGFSPAATTMAYGIEMKWPIYQGGGISAAGKQAAYRLEESRQHLRQVEQQIDVMVLGLVMAIESDIKRYEAINRLVASSAALVQVAEKSYHNGSGTLLAWFESEKQAAELEKNRAAIRYDYVEHRLSLQRLAGELSVQSLQAVNGWLETR